MDALRVNLKDRAYDILVGADLLRQAGKMIRRLELGRRLGLVTHPALAETYGYVPPPFLRSARLVTRSAWSPFRRGKRASPWTRRPASAANWCGPDSIAGRPSWLLAAE